MENFKPVPRKIGKGKTLTIFIGTVIFGYIFFIIPDVFFGVTKINGGKIGLNLFYIAIFQLVSIVCLLYFSLKSIHRDFSSIGLGFAHWKKDSLLGLGGGCGWTLLQFAFIIPNTGGENRLDIQGILTMYDGTIIGLLSFIALGVIGGGITEELFNRGYFISVLKDTFQNPKLGIWVSASFSILLFAVGHMPSTSLDWFDILVPSVLYTGLFLYSGRLTASIIAHGVYNLLAILLVYYLYYL